MPQVTTAPPAHRSPFNIVAQAARAADRSAERAGVEVRALTDIETLREAAALLVAVWGRTPEGVPMNSEVMRSLIHAGGLVSGAYDPSGALAGVAVLGRGRARAGYSYLAGIRPGGTDSGVGFALKQHQRAWALQADIDTIEWTFDPLVSRNARFNLTKLGAVVRVYEPAFYGRMSDAINGDDPADRLVASWQLASARVVAASEHTLPETRMPAADTIVIERGEGPDGDDAWIDAGEHVWCRVPRDIVAVRADDPARASAWREAVRQRLEPALQQGFVAVDFSRDGWYHLSKEER